MKYCPKHEAFNRFCRDCLRRKYAAQERTPVEDGTGYSGPDTPTIDSPPPEFNSRDF